MNRHPDVNTVYRVGTRGEKEWFIKNKDLILPEYIIHHKYSVSDVSHTISSHCCKLMVVPFS